LKSRPSSSRQIGGVTDTTLGELATALDGSLTDEAAAGQQITGIRSLRVAAEHEVSFCWGAPRYIEQARATRAAAIICDKPIEGVTRPLLLVEDARLAMSRLLSQIRDRQNAPPSPGVHPSAFVDATAELGAGVVVGPGAVIEAGAKIGAGSWILANAFVGRGTTLGEACVLHPGAVVLHHCRLGARVVLWPFAVIGRDGFGFFRHEGRHLRIPQVGGVVLGDDVEVGAYSSIDRGTVEPTIVEEGAKIDSHCHVAHNCRIGAHALLIGYARMGGSVSIGKDAILAQNAAVGEGLTVGDGAVLATSCEAYYEDVPGGATMLGAPARPFMQQKRIDLITGTLPGMHRELRDLRKRLEALEALGSVTS